MEYFGSRTRYPLLNWLLFVSVLFLASCAWALSQDEGHSRRIRQAFWSELAGVSPSVAQTLQEITDETVAAVNRLAADLQDACHDLTDQL
jgi:hypothetical protein